MDAMRNLLKNKQLGIACLALTSIATYLAMLLAGIGKSPNGGVSFRDAALLVALVLGGLPLLLDLLRQLVTREFGSDLLAGISIVTSVALHEYLAGTIVVLMLSGGQALEAFAVRKASSVLEALAKRMPSVAHSKIGSGVVDVPLANVAVDDEVVIFPHEISPVDGVVVDGHGVMDESYLTGEPYQITKTPGSDVLSGAINGESALTIRATKLAVDSRYTKIMEVMRSAEQKKPRLRRIADQLGAYYTPIAVAIALAAWGLSAQPVRFLAVMVVATPCPLLIAIPVAIISSISLAARRGIIIKDPSVLEKLDTCRVAIFDKTGTLTYGKANLIETVVPSGQLPDDVLTLAASLERYSKHPLSASILAAAAQKGLALLDASEISEKPGEGLRGIIAGANVQVISRNKLALAAPEQASLLPPVGGGMECVILVDGKYAALLRFRDEPRRDGASFIHHLGPKHHFSRVMLVSGDRESEVRFLAKTVGITEILFSQSPEQKLELVRAETKVGTTVFLGDGINDAPALTAATVGIAFGQNSDITSEAAGAVIMDSSLQKVDELLHISRRMRRIALQSAFGGMGLSVLGMIFAATGQLAPVTGAILQEVIDVLAVLNALRAAIPPKSLVDF